MTKIEIKELIESGVHFGHLTRKWNPNMSPYIYMERMEYILLIYIRPQVKFKRLQKH